MNWPDIFFKAKRSRPTGPVPTTSPPNDEPKPVEATAPTEQATTPGASGEKFQPPAIRPVPAGLPPQSFPKIVTPPPAVKPETATRTLPAMHGVVLRPPSSQTLPPVSPPKPPSSLKNMEQLMAEADPLHPVNQASSTMRLSRLPEPGIPAPVNGPPRPQVTPLAAPPAAPATAKLLSAFPAGPALPTRPIPLSPSPSAVPPVPSAPPSSTIPAPSSVAAPLPAIASTSVPRATVPIHASDLPVSPAASWPEFPPAPGTRTAPVPVPTPPTVAPVPPATSVAPAPTAPQPATFIASSGKLPGSGESPFILKPSVNLTSTKASTPPRAATTAALLPFGPVVRRRARMTDLARIVLPPKREEVSPLTSSGPISTIVPPSFPVPTITPRPFTAEPTAESAPKSSPASSETKESEAPVEITSDSKSSILEPPMQKEAAAPAGISDQSAPDEKPESPTMVKPESSATVHASPIEAKTTTPETSLPPAAEAPKTAPVPTTETKSEPFPSTKPEVDPEAHKDKGEDPLAPKLDPEAHKPATLPTPVSTTPPERSDVAPKKETAPVQLDLGPAVVAPERREFHLANGERVAGVVLSETPEAVYLDHTTLGVLTLPRAQIAKRLVEVILINGDRVVGDLMAETADTMYVRHVSLGMLTVPRSQRSTRVVEAILKDGDRILGEVLTETENFTVIRSATLGTVTVQHAQVAMLNRKIEQIELKALPSGTPELKDKPAEK